MSLTFSPGLDDIPSLSNGPQRGRQGVMAMLASAINGMGKAFANIVGTARTPARQIVVAAPVDAALIAAGRRNISLPASAMTVQEQWTRAVRPLEAATETAQAANALHEAAGRQLDSVDYALQQLLDDLSAVMPVVRTPRASIHQLPAGHATGLSAGRSLAA